MRAWTQIGEHRRTNRTTQQKYTVHNILKTSFNSVSYSCLLQDHVALIDGDTDKEKNIVDRWSSFDGN